MDQCYVQDSINLYLQIINGYIWKDCDQLNRNKLVTENITLKIQQGQDWSYIPAKVGYHLISVMPTQFTGTYEIISGVSWQDSQYAVFLRAAPQTQHSFPAMAIWLPLK